MKHYFKILLSLIVIGLFFGVLKADKTFAEYPEKMVAYVVPFKAGGGGDRTARILSTAAIDNFGQPFHVINKPGASGIMGWKYLLNAPADGYTIMHNPPTPIIALLMEKNPPLSPFDVKVACYVAGYRSIVMSKPGTEWDTWEKFKAFAKKNPGKISMAGTLTTLVGVAYMIKQADIKINLIPYPSTADGIADFLGGHIDTMAYSASTALTLGPKRVMPVVNTNDVPLPKNMKAFEGVPNATDLGYKGLYFPRWLGVHPDTPDEIVEIISQKMNKLVQDNSVKSLFKKVGEELRFVPRDKAKSAYKEMVEAMKLSIEMLK